MDFTHPHTTAHKGTGLVIAIALGLTAPAATQDTPRPLPGIYAARRDGLANMTDEKVAQAIRRGLTWLEAHQDKEGLQAGRWAARDFMRHDPENDRCDGAGDAYDVGTTGLALLAFLANGAGLRDGPDRDVVVRGLEWLIRNQSKETGALGNQRLHDFIYEHAIATLALCEGYGFLGGEVRRNAAQRALRYLAQHRNPDGAWRYEPKAAKGDTSITTWCVHACVAGRDFGLDADPDMDQRVLAWLDRVTNRSSGLIGYDAANQGSSRVDEDHRKQFPPHHAVLSASGTWARTLLGMHAEDEAILRKSLGLVERVEPEWNVAGGRVDYYYWYHGATALAANGRGERWVKSAFDILVDHQRTDGAAAGSWDPVGVWGKYGGRLMSTSLALLTLQVHHRYAPRDAINLLPGGPPFDAIREPWLAGHYAEAEAALKVLEESGLEGRQAALIAATRAAFDKLVIRAGRRVEELAKGPDYLEARRQLEEMLDRWAGLPPHDAIKNTLKTFKKDKKIKRAIKAGEELAKIVARYDPDKSRYQRKTMLSKLKSLANRYAGTHAAMQATRMRREIE